MLIEFAENMRTEEAFARVVAAASKTCENLGFRFQVLEPKERNPGLQQRCKIVSWIALSRRHLRHASVSAEERLCNEMRVNFFLPVLDTFLCL